MTLTTFSSASRAAGTRLRRPRLLAGLVLGLLALSAPVRAQTALPDATINQPYASGNLFQATGVTNPQCQILSGALPAGLAAAVVGTNPVACEVRGTPTATGTFDFTLALSGLTGVIQSGNYRLTVLAGPSLLQVTPSSLSFTATRGGSAPPVQVFTISGNSTTLPQVAFTITEEIPWLSVTTPATFTPSTATVSVNPANLAAGTYTGIIRVTPTTPGAGSPRDVTVTLVVAEAPTASLAASPAQISFTANAGSPSAPPQQITINNLGPTVDITAVASQPWLTVTPASGTVPAAGSLPLTLTLNPSGLEAGTYSAQVTINSGGRAVLTIPVNVAISGVTLTVSPAVLNLSVNQGGTTSGLVSIGQQGGANTPIRIEATTETGGNWLSIVGLPANPSTPLSVAVQANATGLAPGTYRGTVTVRSGNDAVPALPKSVVVILTVAPPEGISISPAALSFTFVRGRQNPTPQPFAVTSTVGTVGFNVTDDQPWLSVSPQSGTTPAILTATVNPAGLASGTYQGTITVTFNQANVTARTIQVTLTVTDTISGLIVEPSAVQLNAPTNGPLQSANVTLTAGAQVVSYQVQSNQPWLTATPSSGLLLGNTQGVLTIAASPTGLAPGIYTGAISIVPSGQSTPLTTIPVLLTVGAAPTGPQTSFISRFADGAGQWRTIITLVNSGAQAATYRLRFFNEQGQPLPLAFNGGARSATAEGTIPANGSRTLESTSGPADPFVTGWGELVADRTVGGVTVYRALNAANGRPDQEAGVPFTPAGVQSFLLPFDNTPNQFITSMAVTNPSATATVTLEATVRDEVGQFLGQQTLTLAPLSQAAFELAARIASTAGRRGVVTFTASSAVAAIGLRFTAQGGAFTSFEPVLPVTAAEPATTQYFPQIADGAGWRTTLLLVSRDSQTASFTGQAVTGVGSPFVLPLAGSGGPVSQLSDIVFANGLKVIQTLGTTPQTVSGYIELMPSRPLGGLAVFRSVAAPGGIDQEAAVPISTAVRAFVLPFDNVTNATQRSVTSMALINPGAVANSIQVVVRDEEGATIQTQTLNLAAREHRAFEIPSLFTITANRRGTIEFTGSTGDVAGIGLRFRNGSFTSLPVLPRQ